MPYILFHVGEDSTRDALRENEEVLLHVHEQQKGREGDCSGIISKGAILVKSLIELSLGLLEEGKIVFLSRKKFLLQIIEAGSIIVEKWLYQQEETKVDLREAQIHSF